MERKGYGIVHNVYLLGGAALVDKKDSPYWKRVFSVCSGRVVNGFATNDWILKLFQAHVGGSSPIGSEPIVEARELDHREEDYYIDENNLFS